MNHPPIDLSIVVPAYNEEENLRPLYEAIRSALADVRRSYELILVDDGSRDGTWRVIRELSARDSRVRGAKLRGNCGETAAGEAGIRLARGRYVVTMDADLQNDPSDLPRLLETIESGRWDMVCGSRVHNRRDNLLRRVSSRVANRVRNLVSNEDIRDAGCTYRIFRRDRVDRIKFYRGMHRFLPTLFRIEGYRVCEVPVTHHPRHAGRSKYGVWNRVFAASADLLAVRWMKKRHVQYEIAEEASAA